MRPGPGSERDILIRPEEDVATMGCVRKRESFQFKEEEEVPFGVTDVDVPLSPFPGAARTRGPACLESGRGRSDLWLSAGR